MRLAIADPPYLGRGAALYGPGANGRRRWGSGPRRRESHRHETYLSTTEHPDAQQWDKPARHTQLVHDLDRDYDGWAIAAAADSLLTYLQADPDLWVAVWNRQRPVPTGYRVIRAWEIVVLRIPHDRLTNRALGNGVLDLLSAPPPNIGHVGAKPRAWTRWVLDMLGYDQDTDTVTDLFPGSGLVSAEIAQLTFGIDSATRCSEEAPPCPRS